MQTERSWSLEFFHRLLARGHTQEALGPIFDTAEKNAEAYLRLSPEERGTLKLQKSRDAKEICPR
eukprot:scaffold202792_cov36-Cyclotella_meneghiniana.AAC.1